MKRNKTIFIAIAILLWSNGDIIVAQESAWLHRADAMHNQAQTIVDMADAKQTSQKEFVIALRRFDDTLGSTVKSCDNFDHTLYCRGRARSLAYALMDKQLPFPLTDTVKSLIMEALFWSYYWNMPSSYRNKVCMTTMMTSNNDGNERYANIILETTPSATIIINDILGDVNDVEVSFVGKEDTSYVDLSLTNGTYIGSSKTLKIWFPLHLQLLSPITSGLYDRIHVVYSAGGRQMTMDHIILPLPAEWMQELYGNLEDK